MSTKNTPSPLNRHAAIQPAIAAFKAYWPAIVFVQSCALVAVISYYTIDTDTHGFGRIAEWKQSGGLLFAAITTMVSGGILPELLKRCFRSKDRTAPSRIEFAHQLVMWALLGMLVDRFYYLQGILFVTATNATTTLTKVAFDQLRNQLGFIRFLGYQVVHPLLARNSFACVFPLVSLVLVDNSEGVGDGSDLA